MAATSARFCSGTRAVTPGNRTRLCGRGTRGSVLDLTDFAMLITKSDCVGSNKSEEQEQEEAWR